MTFRNQDPSQNYLRLNSIKRFSKVGKNRCQAEELSLTGCCMGCVKRQRAKCKEQFYSVKFEVSVNNQIDFTKLFHFTKFAFCPLPFAPYYTSPIHPDNT